MAAGVAGDEVWDKLLVEVVFFVYGFKSLFEFVEEGERGLAHNLKDRVGSVFWGHF